MQTSWIENLGDGKFKMHALPTVAQLGPVYGILPKHLDEDDYIDLLLIGNDYGIEVQQGRADALVGLALKNDGKGNFKPISLEKSQFYVPGDGKSLVSLIGSDEKTLIIASQNNDSLRVFHFQRNNFETLVKISANETKAEITYANGKRSIQEFYWGNTFQSQSSRTLTVTKGAKLIRFFDYLGNLTREITLPLITTKT